MKLFRVLILFAIILIAFGCDDKSPTENDPEPGEVVLSDETVVLDETQVNVDLQSVSPDGTTFTFSNTSTTDDIEEGDILVSGITDLMPNGFLRKVTNLQENTSTITVTTENASLDEALQQGDLEANYTFEPSQIVNAVHAEGVELISSSREDLFSLTINMIFYDADGNTNTTDDQITMVGTLEFTAEMLINLSISNWQLNEFDIQLENTFERDLTFDNSIEYNLQAEETIASYNFPVVTFFIGVVPVTILPTINVTAYVDASLQAGISFGVTATETMSTGAQYLNGNWSPISTYTKTLNYSGPTGYGSIEAQAGLRPQLQTMLYGVVGPYIVLDAYGKFDCDVEISFDDLLISEEILFGLNLDAGLFMEVLSHTVFNYSMDIYDEEWILHQYEYTIGQAPIATIISPSNGAQFDLGDNVHFEGTATDEQDGQLTGNDLEWFSNIDGSLGFGENLYISTLSQGPHTITLIATDSDDYTGEDEVSINILDAGNNPPSMPFDPSPDDEATNISINTNLSWNCTDPEGDPLTYDVYFGTSPNPPLFEQDLSQSSFDLNELDYEETYYWKIKAFDDHDNSTTGEVWEFTTLEQGSGVIPVDYFAYYPFNGNANDLSLNQFNGTPQNGVDFTATDRFGSTSHAISCDGVDDNISIPIFDLTTERTFSAWVKTTQQTASPLIFRGNVYWGDYFYYFSINDEGKLYYGHSHSGNNVQGLTAINDGEWHHLVATWDGNTVNLYIDNVLDNTEDYSVNPSGSTSNDESYICSTHYNNGSSSGFYNGVLDDLILYNRVLTESEIDAIFHEGGWSE